MKGGGNLTAYEHLSLMSQFSNTLIAVITITVTMVVYINKKK
ncbi:putative holin-like toxin [Oceanobacillus halophilus]